MPEIVRDEMTFHLASDIGEVLDAAHESFGVYAPRYDRPPLRVHVTLARKVVQAPVLQAMSPLHWNARSFSLVRSDTGGARSVYTVVDTWQLLDECPKR